MGTCTGWYLHRCRTRKGLSLETVARDVSFTGFNPSRSTLRHFESGKQLPKQEELFMLAHGYFVDKDILEKFHEADEKLRGNHG